MASSSQAAPARISLGVKLAFTAFLAVLVPVYTFLYGPFVMLYFCDVALVLVFVALWWESPLFTGMAAVGVLLGQILWIVDVATGARVGLAGYMFDDQYPLFARLLSLFHAWLPLLMLWMLARLGYDRRAFAAYTLLAWVLLVISYLWLPAPPASPAEPLASVNVNYVYGLGTEPQTWMHPHWWFALLLVGFPLAFYLPTHLALSALFRNPDPRPIVAPA